MEGENVDEDILALGPSPFEVEVDLMTPIDPEGSPKVSNCEILFLNRQAIVRIFSSYNFETGSCPSLESHRPLGG